MSYDQGKYGYGQVLAPYGMSGGHFYLGIFGKEYSGDGVDLDTIISEQFALLALSMDALLYHGHWTVIGNATVPEERFQLPEYKVATAPGHCVVEDAFGDVVRPATKDDVARLPYRKVVAPIVVQDAFEALHGARDWRPEYDTLRA